MSENGRGRIMVLTRGFPPLAGGIERTIMNVYSRLRRDYDVLVVTPREDGWEASDCAAPFAVARSRKLPFLGDKFQTPLIGMFMTALLAGRRFRPTQIHCDQVDTAFIGRLLAARFGVPYIIYAHGMEVTDGNRVAIKRWAFGGAAAIMPPSRYTADRLVEIMGTNPSTTHVVHPGVEWERFQNSDAARARVTARRGLDGKRVVLTVGRMPAGGRSKGQDRIIACLPRILSTVPETVYLIVGDGPDRARLEALARTTGVAGSVIFAGRVPDEDLPGYYAACDLLAMVSPNAPSRHGGILVEGFGIVFLEANACGKPVVGARCGGIADAVLDGETGILVDPDDPEAIAEAVVRLLTDEATARELGRRGCERARTRMTYDSMARQVGDIARELENGKR